MQYNRFSPLPRLKYWCSIVVVVLWASGSGGMSPCVSASIIATVREDGLSLFRSVSALLPDMQPMDLFGEVLRSTSNSGDSSGLDDGLDNDLVQGDALGVRRRLLGYAYGVYRISDDVPGVAEAVLLSRRLGRPILVLILNENRRLSPRSFLVNRQGVFPVGSLEGSGISVPAIQLLGVDGLWYPITAGAGVVSRSQTVDDYLAMLRPQVEALSYEFGDRSDCQLRQVMIWYTQLRRLLVTIPDHAHEEDSVLAGYIAEFRVVMLLVQRFYLFDGFGGLVNSLGSFEPLTFFGLLLEHRDMFGFVLKHLTGDFELLSADTNSSANQLFIAILASIRSLDTAYQPGNGYVESGTGLPIRFNRDRVYIQFNAFSYVDQLLLILHLRYQMLKFTRIALMTYKLGLSAEQLQVALKQQDSLINKLQAMIQALIKKHYGNYWGESYYRPITFMDSNIVLFHGDIHAPFSGWKDSFSGLGDK